MPESPITRLRRICLALPGATEVEAWGAPTFRCGKIFAMYSSPTDHQHSGGRPGVWLKAAPGNQELMVRDRPDRFFVPPYVGPSGWIGVRLDKRPPWREIAELVRESYVLVAPKKLVKALNAVKSLLLALGLATVAAPPLAAQAADDLRRHVLVDDPVVALVGVSVIDGSGAAVRHDQTIVIEGARIRAVGDAATVPVPANARVLRLDGHTVIPGIVGMHNHTHMPGNTFLEYSAPRLYLGSGVTTILTAGSAESEREIALAAAIERGERIGPRIFPTAPYVTGADGNGPMDKPATPDEARAFVRRWSAKGARGLKLYRHVTSEIAAAIIDEARVQNLRVTGHLCSLTFAEAVALGIDGIEHGLISATDFVANKDAGRCVPNAASLAALDLKSPEVHALIAAMVERGVTLTSTLAIIESHFPHRPQGDARALAAMTPAWVERYEARQRQLRADADGSRYTPQLYEKLVTFERMFVAAGGRLVAGPDPGRHVLPGFGDQRNVELLVEADYSVPQAIRIVTANGAAALGASDQFGSVRAGLRADLVVLRGALASEPAVIREPTIVFKDGVGYNPRTLIGDVEGQVGAR